MTSHKGYRRELSVFTFFEFPLVTGIKDHRNSAWQLERRTREFSEGSREAALNIDGCECGCPKMPPVS